MALSIPGAKTDNEWGAASAPIASANSESSNDRITDWSPSAGIPPPTTKRVLGQNAGTTLAARFPHLGVERCHRFEMHRHAGREARRVNAAATSLGGLATCLGADLSWPGLSGPIRTRPSWCGGISRPGLYLFPPEQSPGLPWPAPNRPVLCRSRKEQ